MHTAELSQVGSKGTTIVETSFGLSLTADFLITPKVKASPYGRRVVGKNRHRVIKVMSLCCASAYTRKDNNPRAPISCHSCRKSPPWTEDYLDFSLANDYTLGQAQLETLVEQALPNVLEASLASSGLFHLLEDLFSAVQRGERVSSVVTLRPSAEV